MCGVIVGSTWSPDIITPSVGSNRQRWSSVWPGVCTAIHSRSPRVRVWASSTRTVGRGMPANRGTIRAITYHARRRGDIFICSPPHGGGSNGLLGRTSGDPSPVGGGGCGILGVEVARVETVPEHLETTVGDDVGTGLAAHVRRAAVVVRVRVGHHHGVHAAHRDAGGAQPRHDRPARGAAGQPRVDQRDAAAVLDHVAVGVAEAGHVDRQLTAQHARRHLDHVDAGVLLLLARWPRRAVHPCPPYEPDPVRGDPGGGWHQSTAAVRSRGRKTASR